ncbi:hypothetical protein BDN72DRAFT_848550 [Pluteus cervinus]|uniref:Uncharacterized protein n=1 Tax=Pluteus cervinus TaxID=181527 RepID=A0ACD3AAV1_9AGAR|nr:hypothetical protein BDN72DRAFT_848550 [Pluteus cervinus]
MAQVPLERPRDSWFLLVDLKRFRFASWWHALGLVIGLVAKSRSTGTRLTIDPASASRKCQGHLTRPTDGWVRRSEAMWAPMRARSCHLNRLFISPKVANRNAYRAISTSAPQQNCAENVVHQYHYTSAASKSVSNRTKIENTLPSSDQLAAIPERLTKMSSNSVIERVHRPKYWNNSRTKHRPEFLAVSCARLITR